MDAQADWWRTFFSGLIVESWLMSATAEETRKRRRFHS